MEKEHQFAKDEDLVFFGKVNASISHELKNIMAIISETAGLMNDLLEMAPGGNSTELEPVINCSTEIMEEIQRGFAVVNQMNRFSHSFDEVCNIIDLLDTIELTVQLIGFLSFHGSVRLEDRNDRKIPVETCPFRLHHLLYQTLRAIIMARKSEADIHISVSAENGDRAEITFSGFGSLDPQEFSTDSIQELARSIDADIRVADDLTSIHLGLRSIACN